MYVPFDTPVPLKTSKDGLQISFFTKKVFGETIVVYTDKKDEIKEFVNLKSNEYQNAFDNFVRDGYYPILVQAMGDDRTSEPFYGGLFKKQ
jgi:hypothetical protein